MSKHETVDDQLNRLVDTRQISYSEAYAELGLPVPPAAPVSAAATEARIADHDYYSKEFGLTGNVQLTPEEQQRLHLGVEACKAAINEPKG